jgi:hypothetical protein
MVLRYSIPHSRQNPREKDPRPVAGRNRGPRRRRDGNVFGPEMSFLLFCFFTIVIVLLTSKDAHYKFGVWLGNCCNTMTLQFMSHSKRVLKVFKTITNQNIMYINHTKKQS